MKRLILMGGRPWLAQDGGRYFAEVLFRYFPTDAKVGFCNFAQPESDWPETEKWNTGMFNRFKGKRNLHFKTMTSSTVQDVSKWADIIYIPGGNPFTLLEKLNAYDLTTLWDNKVLAGSSAGADFFCVGFAYLQDKSFGRGLGWVKTTCIPHWRDEFEDYSDADWDWAEQESLKQFPDLPVFCIPEGKFAEFTTT